MCSKPISKFSCLWITALSLILITCARESQPSNPAVDVKMKDGGECLEKFGDNLNKYFKGRMTKAEVITFWDCTAQAVNDYQRLTSGDGAGGTYSPQGLRRFLYRYFFKTKPLGDTLLASLMEIKRVLLAGSVSEITRDDLKRLQNLMVELKALSLDMHPYVLVLFGDQRASDSQVSEAAQSFERATQRLGRWLDLRQEPYTFDQLHTLIAEVRQWQVEDKNNTQALEKLEQVIAIMPEAKRLLVSGEGRRIEGDSWIHLMKMIGHGFHVYLNFKHTFQDNMNSGFVRNLMPDAMSEGALVLEDAVRRRGGPGLPMSEWKVLFERMEQSALLPKEFTAEASFGGFRWLIERTLGHGSPTEYLSYGHIRRLREQQGIWRNLLARVNGQEYSQIPEIGAFDSVLARSAPMQWDSEGRLEHPRVGPKAWTTDSRRHMVWCFFFINWLRDSYIGAEPSMSEDQISVAVSEILPMLQKFGWMKDTKLSIGKRILREADLFTEASTGDFQLDMAEAVRYLAFVGSGLRVAEVWLEEADRLCGNRRVDCVREIATRADSHALDPLPHLRAAILRQPPEFFIKYLKQAEETVLSKITTGSMGTKDLMLTWQILQYVEAFLKIYDENGSERIDLPEALLSFDRYGPTLAKLLRASNMPRDEILAFFTFMMKYGDTPFGMFGGQILFNHWKWHRNDWAFQAERATLMSILNQLSKL